jgi:[ribosomal protein S5]-alanine N-acetyltransferase
MFDLDSLPITTDRLILKPVSIEYAEDIYHYFDRDVTQFTYSEPNRDLEQAIDFIHAARMELLNRSGLSLAIIDRQSQEFLGICGILRTNTPTPEPGLWVKKTSHGRGYGKESMTGVVQWVWQNMKCDRLIYKADRRNLASQKIARSLGGELVGEEENINPHGKVLDLLVYQIDRELRIKN